MLENCQRQHANLIHSINKVQACMAHLERESVQTHKIISGVAKRFDPQSSEQVVAGAPRAYVISVSL
jgi:hypothetical protein